MRIPIRHEARDGTVTWRVRFREGVSRKTGKPKQTCETFSSEHDARRFAQLLDVGLSADAALREMGAAPAAGRTLDDLFAEFAAWKQARVRSDRTVADYRRDWRNWVSPALGSRPADSVTESDVQRLVDQMTDAGLSPKSVADRHALLHQVYRWAVAPSRAHALRNPCVDTDMPKRRKSPPKGLKLNEWHALHAALKAIDPDAADIAEFMLVSGWRWSEAAAIDVFDVEDDGVSVHVNMGRVLRRDAAGRHVLVDDEGKGDASIRRIKLDPDAAETVRRRIEGRTSGLVFTNRSGLQWHYANFLNRAWHPAVKAAGLSRKPSPHWLRHTHVNWLLMGRQVSLPELQRRIGHAHISTTVDVYGRMVDDVSDAALESFAAMRRLPELGG